MVMAIGARLLVVEIHFAALCALDDLARDFHAAVGARWCLVADLSSTFRTFNNSHVALFVSVVVFGFDYMLPAFFYLCLNLMSRRL